MANETTTLIPGQPLDLREVAQTREQALTQNTVPGQLEPLPPLPPLEKPGMTTPQKVGVGVGVAGATGFAAWGLYRLGERMGWWGGPTIIFDDEPPKQDGGGKKTTPPAKKGRAAGRPPNFSGDSAGYNTTLWNSPGPVRLALVSQGYKVEVTNDPLAEDGQANAQVRRLQQDWNKVIRALDSGKVKLPSGVNKPKLLAHYRGLLVADGIPGKNTLNALEVVFTNYRDNGISWKAKLVSKA